MPKLGILRHVSWITVGFAVQQFIRLATNVVLAAIVSPAVFGIMLILNTLRTGAEQISDVGVGQNIVYDKMGNRPAFYNTAWTIQILRGMLLFATFWLVSPLLTAAFGDDDLGRLLPVFGLIFVIAGFAPPTRYLLQKKHRISQLVLLEVGVAIVGAISAISFALISPTATALVWALLLTAIVGNLAATAMMNWRNIRLMMDRLIARRIILFGKWVFIASLLYFAATSFDRLYLAGSIPLALLGVYGIARTFSDAAFQFAHKISTLIVFPRVADDHNHGLGLEGLIRPRGLGVLIAGVLLGVSISLSDIVIRLLYDARYGTAALMLPILIGGAWFSVLAVIYESVVYGSGKPAINAIANGAKFIWLIATVPLALMNYGFVWALAAIAVSDIPRYIVLAASHSEQRGKFIRQDVRATLSLLASAALARALLIQLGIVSDFLPHVMVVN